MYKAQKNKRRLFKCLLLLLSFITILSCGDDEDTVIEETEITVTAEDFIIAIDEFPEDNYIIGQMEAETNMGSIAFSLEQQNPSEALIIDEATGELRVNDGSLFSFETNPIITALIKASNAEIFKDATITITVNEPQGPNYHKMIDVNNVWVYTENFDTGVSGTDKLHKVYFNGEGIINGETYSNLYQRVIDYSYGSIGYSFSNNSVREETLLYKLREDIDTRKVFILHNNEEFLLYDFSLDVNDVIDLWNTETNNYVTQTVLSIEDFDLLNGETRKKINFESDYSIIESIGFRENNYFLKCFFNGTTIMYSRFNSCDESFWDEGDVPVLNLETSYLVDQKIRSKCNLVGDGGNHIENNIFEKGICWSSTSQNPTVDDNFTSSYSNEAPINNNRVSDLRRFYTVVSNSNLQPNTTYYFRSYSKNANGVAYSDTVKVVDTAFLTSTLDTVLINSEVIGNSEIRFQIEGSLSQNNFPVNATIVEKGFAVSHIYRTEPRALTPKSPSGSQRIPIQGGSLGSFEHLEVTSLGNQEISYDFSYIWAYVKFDSGFIVYGNRLVVN